MKKDNNFFSDFTKLTESVLNTAINAKREIAQIILEQMSKLLKNHDFVSREEFEVLKKIALTTKHDLETLAGLKPPKPYISVSKDKKVFTKTSPSIKKHSRSSNKV